jgi:hypothetical protein
LWRKDIIEEQVAITLRLSVSAILARLFPLMPHFMSRSNRAPQKDALLPALTQYSKLELRTWLLAQST